MKNIILKNGLISGFMVSAILLISMNYYSYCNGNVSEGVSMLIGFSSMILAFFFIFLGIRKYRDVNQYGKITFGKALVIGLGIALIASTMYVVTWLFYYNYFNPDFLEKYQEMQLATLKNSGASLAEIQQKKEEMELFGEKYKNPIFNVLITYTEILPIGILVSIISAWILKKNNEYYRYL